MPIYGISGTFWKWKTSTAVQIMIQNQKPWVKIYTNIKVNTKILKNVSIISDSEIVDTLDQIILDNLEDRKKYTKYEATEDLPAVYDRWKFTKTLLILDECWVILDSSMYNDKKQTDIRVRRFLDQNRKVNCDVYLVLPKMERLLMLWRRYTTYWLEIRKIPIIDVNVVYAYERNEDWSYVEDMYVWKDQKWNEVTMRKIRKYYLFWYWVPKLYNRMYDDWYLTGIDPDDFGGMGDSPYQGGGGTVPAKAITDR